MLLQIDMMNDTKLLLRKKAFDCLLQHSISVGDMARTLHGDGVISARDIEKVLTSEDKSLELFKMLEKAYKDEKVILLDYEWQMLPTVRILLTIVTQFGVREFNFAETR